MALRAAKARLVTNIPPINASILQANQAQRTASADRTDSSRRSQELQRKVDSNKDDYFDAQVEDSQAVDPIKREEEQSRRWKRQKRRDHAEQSDDDEQGSSLDVTG